MFEMPDSCPTSSGSTTAVEADDAGPFASPSPTAITTSGITNARYVHDAVTNTKAAHATAARPNPSAIALREPILTASGVMSGVIAIIAAAAGRVARPACNALIPNADGFWKYKLSTYINALIAPATLRIASVTPTRIAFRSSLRDTSG